MSGLELVPYRTPAPPAIERIDPSIVPDCGRAETRSLARRIEDADSEIDKLRERLFIRMAIAPPLAGLSVIVITAALVAGMKAAVLALTITLLVFLAPSIFLLNWGFMKWGWSRHPEVQRLRELHGRLTARLQQRASLERLTGTARQAEELEGEISLFNSDIGNLPVDALNAHVLDKIEARRRSILERVNAFRRDIMPAAEAEEPKLLPPPDAA